MDTISFGALCDFMEDLRESKENKKKIGKLSRFLTKCRDTLKKDNNDTDLFPIIRLLVPQLDRERGSYGIKETLLSKIVTNLLKLGKTDADRLKNYKTPGKTKDSNDFATILGQVMKDRAYPRTNISIVEINQHLSQLILMNANKEGVTEVLMEVFKKMDAVMIKWLVRIILKSMNFEGLGHNGILKCFHQDAKELFDTNSDLRKVCQSLRDPEKRIHEIEINLFTPFKPMLAENVPMNEIEARMGHKPFYVEVKYDGERMLAHRNSKGEFKFFSRNMKDFTDDFGSHGHFKDKFSYHLNKALAASKVQNVILDGEICPYNKITNSLTQKGEQMDIRHLKDDHPVYQQCLYIYDILYLNGRVLTNLPMNQRVAMIREIVPKDFEGRIYVAERKIISTNAEVQEALNEAIDHRDEGIMIKDPDSIYKPGARPKSGWIKVKPDYQNLTDNCDLVIVGGYYSSGSKLKIGTLSHFLCAVKDGDTFRSFTRVSSGVSHKELYDLVEKLKPHMRPKPFTGNVKYGKEKPDMKIDPRKSVILEIRAAEITKSNTYDVGCTLRFPRVVKIRHDKSWSDCMTFKDLENLKATNDGKLTKRHANQEAIGEDAQEEGPSSPKKRKLSKTPKLDSLYQPAAGLDQVKATSKVLAGKVFVVEPSSSRGSMDQKVNYERIIAENGGKVEQNPAKGHTWAFISSSKGHPPKCTVRAQNVINAGYCNVIRDSWLANGYRPLGPWDFLYTTEESQRDFEPYFDEFGDSFKMHATEESLTFSLKEAEEKGQKSLSREDIADFEFEYGRLKYGLFRTCQAAVFHEGLDKNQSTFAYYGGEVRDKIDCDIQFYFVPEDIEEVDLKMLKLKRKSVKSAFKIVTEDWIDDCIENDDLLNEDEYVR